MSSEHLRLFFAVDVPEDRLVALATRAEPLRQRSEGARWIPVENQHVTLKFLGSTPEGHVSALLETMRAVSARHAPFELRLAELGTFPERGKARVLWAGFDDPSPVRDLAVDLDAALVPLGHQPENRPFSAHLTLARFRIPAPVRGLVDVDLEGLDPFTVSEVGLWRSRLSPQGARYERLGGAALGARA